MISIAIILNGGDGDASVISTYSRAPLSNNCRILHEDDGAGVEDGVT